MIATCGTSMRLPVSEHIYWIKPACLFKQGFSGIKTCPLQARRLHRRF
jgi:hypothetical protein